MTRGRCAPRMRVVSSVDRYANGVFLSLLECQCPGRPSTLLQAQSDSSRIAGAMWGTSGRPVRGPTDMPAARVDRWRVQLSGPRPSSMRSPVSLRQHQAANASSLPCERHPLVPREACCRRCADGKAMGESLTQILRADQVREDLIGKHARQCSDDDDADKIDQHEIANLRASGVWPPGNT